jgi:hypothetical protein
MISIRDHLHQYLQSFSKKTQILAVGSPCDPTVLSSGYYYFLTTVTIYFIGYDSLFLFIISIGYKYGSIRRTTFIACHPHDMYMVPPPIPTFTTNNITATCLKRNVAVR